LVVEHLDFLPEESHGNNIFKLSQSTKWLKDLSPDLRVQMVEANSKHFYIYEPLQTKSLELLIPIFFYQEGQKIYSKCLHPVIKSNNYYSKIQINIPANILYNDETLHILPVDEFSLTYSEILTKNGKLLLECCGENLTGMKYLDILCN